MTERQIPLSQSFLKRVTAHMQNLKQEAEELTQALGLPAEAKYDLLAVVSGQAQVAQSEVLQIEREQLITPQGVPPEPSDPPRATSALGGLSLAALTACCLRELKSYRRGEVSTDRYGVELFRRAICNSDANAWEALLQCFGDTVSGWMRNHPRRDMALHVDSEENYVAQTFARFWLATTANRKLLFNTLATALAYLRTCLNSTILDTLRAYSHPKEFQVWIPDIAEEQQVEDEAEQHELWTLLLRMFPKPKEQRLLYLLFHCGLKPREIIQHCPEEFTDVQEVYRLHRNIMDRLIRNAAQLRRLLGDEAESV